MTLRRPHLVAREGAWPQVIPPTREFHSRGMPHPAWNVGGKPRPSTRNSSHNLRQSRAPPTRLKPLGGHVLRGRTRPSPRGPSHSLGRSRAPLEATPLAQRFLSNGFLSLTVGGGARSARLAAQSAEVSGGPAPAQAWPGLPLLPEPRTRGWWRWSGWWWWSLLASAASHKCSLRRRPRLPRAPLASGARQNGVSALSTRCACVHAVLRTRYYQGVRGAATGAHCACALQMEGGALA